MEQIPDNVRNGCPDKCPVCGKPLAMVWRKWGCSKGLDLVRVDFVHAPEPLIEDCVKTYRY